MSTSSKRKLYIEYNDNKLSTDTKFLTLLRQVILNGSREQIKKFIFDNPEKFCDKFTPFKHELSEVVTKELFEYLIESDNYVNYKFVYDLLSARFNSITSLHFFSKMSVNFMISFLKDQNCYDAPLVTLAINILDFLITEGQIVKVNKLIDYVSNNTSPSQIERYYVTPILRKLLVKDYHTAFKKFFSLLNFASDSMLMLLQFMSYSIIHHADKIYHTIVSAPEDFIPHLYTRSSAFPILDYCDTLQKPAEGIPVELPNYYSSCLAILYMKSENISKIPLAPKVDWKRIYYTYLQVITAEYFNNEIAEFLYQRSLSDPTRILTSDHTYNKHNLILLLKFENTLIPRYAEFIIANTDWNLSTGTQIHICSFLQIMKIKNLFTQLCKYLVLNDDNMIYASKFLTQSQIAMLKISKLEGADVKLIDSTFFINLYNTVVTDALSRINPIPVLSKMISSYL
jgi:hypothetical protein